MLLLRLYTTPHFLFSLQPSIISSSKPGWAFLAPTPGQDFLAPRRMWELPRLSLQLVGSPSGRKEQTCTCLCLYSIHNRNVHFGSQGVRMLSPRSPGFRTLKPSDLDPRMLGSLTSRHLSLPDGKPRNRSCWHPSRIYPFQLASVWSPNPEEKWTLIFLQNCLASILTREQGGLATKWDLKL